MTSSSQAPSPITILVIDDLRYWKDAKKPPEGTYRYARNPGEAIALLKSQDWEQVWFDYDLGGNERAKIDIRPVLRYLAEARPNIEVCFVHSMNYWGGRETVHALEKLGYSVIRTQASRFFNSF